MNRIDLETTIQMRKSGREQEVKKIVSAGTGLEIMAKLRGKIREIKETENQFLDDRKKLAREAEIFSTYFAAGSTLIIVGVGGLISWVIIWNIAESLGIAVKVAEEVSAGNLTAISGSSVLTAAHFLGKCQKSNARISKFLKFLNLKPHLFNSFNLVLIPSTIPLVRPLQKMLFFFSEPMRAVFNYFLIASLKNGILSTFSIYC